MKKAFLTIMMILVGIISFANEISHSAKNNISFRMPDMSVRLSDEYDDYYREFDLRTVRSMYIANRAIGIVLSAISSVPIITFFILGAMTGGGMWPYISPVPVYGFQMTMAGILMIYLSIKQAQCVRRSADEPRYKYEMSKVMRNAGIIALSTSVVPLAATIPYIVLSCSTFSFFVFPMISIISGVASLAQLILGITFLVLGISKMEEWAEIVFPEVSVVHDDRKGYNDGYAVNVGLRIRI
ncbi:MAG: hypothetical protein II707_08440 [Spirochaetales bacterium]|nr:hypothetical protein [Spirochaetales bacterium]